MALLIGEGKNGPVGVLMYDFKNEKVFAIMKDVLMYKTLNKLLQIDALVPLFKLR